MSDITQNRFMVKDSFTFADEVLILDSDLYMASLDVGALFTNIPLYETIDICVKKFFKHIFLYFLNHLNLPTRFVNICPLNTRT